MSFRQKRERAASPSHFAIDFGTTNTVVATDLGGSVLPVALEGVMAERTGTPVVPSAVYFPEDGGLASIGQAAINQNLVGLGRRPSFAQGFKRHLGRASLREVARASGTTLSARHAAECFFDGLRVSLRRRFRPRRRGLLGWWDDFCDRRRPLAADVTLTAPVDADELYRRELAALGWRLGARTLRVVDEPVAAALGYGVNVGRELTLLVLDWGGGTLDVSIVRTGPKTLSEGRARVLAKSEAPLGGVDVDGWIVSQFLIPVERYVLAWEMDALWAATHAKEAASIHGEGTFQFRDRPGQPFTRADLTSLLEERGAYAAMERALGDALEQLAHRHRLQPSAVDEALLVGGSSLLPGVDARLRSLLPGARVGEWNPFAAVATGACEFARGGQVTDQVYHDYALRMADDRGNTVYYELIIPAGTAYPTEGAFVERVYTPDPGCPDRILFEICEIARLGRAPVPWQEEAAGRRVWSPADLADHARALVINEGQTLLRLTVPEGKRATREPNSKRGLTASGFVAGARQVRVTYRVDRERYLRWTVRDGHATLRHDEVLGRLR